MPDRVEKQDLVRAVSARLTGEGAGVDTIVDAFLDEQGSWVFRFNPSQRLRKLFGWSSTYRGTP